MLYFNTAHWQSASRAVDIHSAAHWVSRNEGRKGKREDAERRGEAKTHGLLERGLEPWGGCPLITFNWAVPRLLPDRDSPATSQAPIRAMMGRP